MPEKDPFNYSLITYAWVVIISLWGGTSAYIRRARSRSPINYLFVEWVGECVISGGVGVMTFYLCEFTEIDRLLSAVLIAITAHMGSRAILMGERFLCRYVGGRLGLGSCGDLDRRDDKKTGGRP